MSLPNYLTFIRIFICPIFLVVYVYHDALGVSAIWLPYILLFLTSVSEVSDLLDGYFARKFDQVSDLGKVLDPMADSISRISVFLTFTQGPVQLPLILVFIFIYRDSVVGTLRTVCALRGFALAARKSGKLKAVIQAAVAVIVLVLMIPQSLGGISQHTLQVTATWLVSFAAVYTVFSAGDYIYSNWDYIKRLLVKGTE